MTGPYDDPRLTAYVLGESTDAERAEVERLLEASPEARAAADEIGDVASLLERELAGESAPARVVDVAALLAANGGVDESRAVSSSTSAPVSGSGLGSTPTHGSQPRLVSRADSDSEPSTGSAVLVVVAALVAICLLIAVRVGGRPGAGLPSSTLPHGDVISAIDRPTGPITDGFGATTADEGPEGETLSTTPEYDEWVASLSSLGPSRYFYPLVPDRHDLLLPPEGYFPAMAAGGEYPGDSIASDATLSGEAQALAGYVNYGYAGRGYASISNFIANDYAIRTGPTTEPQSEQPPNGERESFNETQLVENPFLSPVSYPVSTIRPLFGTTSLDIVRQQVDAGRPPEPETVRIEELVNAFDYEAPATTPEAVDCRFESGPCPWRTSNQLVRIGLWGRPVKERQPTNATFLVDVSGSMRDGTRLPLVQQGLNDFVANMGRDDQIGIVTYADEPRVALTKARNPGDVQRVVEKLPLAGGGRTNGVSGFEVAYGNLGSNLIPRASNRLVLVTDGGLDPRHTNDPAVAALIEHQAAKGLPLDVVGVREVNSDDLARLARLGGGTYNSVVDPDSTRRVFGEELVGHRPVVAEDVSVVVEFNPARVQSYRLLGFDNHPSDLPGVAGNGRKSVEDEVEDGWLSSKLRAGQSVVVLYEVVPQPESTRSNATQQLRYQQQAPAVDDPASREMLSVAVKYREPTREQQPVERRFTYVDDEVVPTQTKDFTWTAAVATYGLAVRNSPYRGEADLEKAENLASQAVGDDTRRQEFFEVLQRTRSVLDAESRPAEASEVPR